MATTQTDSSLLRETIVEAFRIHHCDVSITVLPDLQTARYVYSYQLERTAPGDDNWREVFAYRVQDVILEHARAGQASGTGGDHGLHYKVGELDTPGKNACLVIDFDRAVPIGGKYEFHYVCRTKIEAIRAISLLGGTGSIWFWCAHEFLIDAMTVTIRLPSGIRITATHPDSPSVADEATYSRAVLVPREFFVALLTFEKRVLGIPVRYAKFIERTATFLMGVAASLLAAYLWRISQGE